MATKWRTDVLRWVLVFMVLIDVRAQSPANAIDELVVAIWRNEDGRAKSLLKGISDVNQARIASDTTPLMAAAERGNTEIMELLLAKGANVNARAQDGSTALLY